VKPGDVPLTAGIEGAIADGLGAAYRLGFHEGIGAAAKAAAGPGVKLNDSRSDIPQRYRDAIVAAILALTPVPK